MSSFSHSQFGGGKFNIDPGSVGLTNCLWQRVYVYLKDMDGDPYWSLFNNLFYGGWLEYRATESPVLLAYDNQFDKTKITKGTSSVTFLNDYNGYVTGQNRLTPNGGNDVILTNSPVYQTSYLGRFYYPTNDGMLSLLINTGSRWATNAALYHYTTTTNQVKEASSKVDIGFHYVAATNGVPIDSDSDGRADYEEFQDGTDPLDPWSVKKRLGLWRFNSTNWTGEGGQLPLLNYGTSDSLVAGVESGALYMGGANYSSQVSYRCTETNGTANIWLTNGTVRFWFNPHWKSVSLGGGGPTGSRLLNIGNYTADASYGLWGVFLSGDQIAMGCQDAAGHGAGSPWGGISMDSNRWYQITCTYTPTNVAIYTNGSLVVSGSGLGGIVPPQGVLDLGFHIGADINGAQRGGGSFDLLETFTYPKSATEISDDYQLLVNGDMDADGIIGKEDANLFDSAASRVKITIESPQSGSTIR